MLAPDAPDPCIAAATGAVKFIAARIFLVIILMIIFGGPKDCAIQYGRDKFFAQ